VTDNHEKAEARKTSKVTRTRIRRLLDWAPNDCKLAHYQTDIRHLRTELVVLV